MTAAYLSTRQAAEYLGVSYDGFDVFVRRHGVPYVKYGNRRKFTIATLDRVLDTMGKRPTKLRRVSA